MEDYYIICCWIKWLLVGHWCRAVEPEEERFSLTDGKRLLIYFRMRHSLRRRKSKSKSKPKFVVKAQAKSKSLRQMLTSCGGNCCFWRHKPPCCFCKRLVWFMPWVETQGSKRWISNDCDVIKKNKSKKRYICTWVKPQFCVINQSHYSFTYIHINFS